MYHDQLKSVCRTFALALGLLLFFLSGELFAGEREEWRVWAGLDLFPTLLAADKDISEKQGPDGRLLLLLLYADGKEMADEMASRLMKVGKIRRIPIRVETTNSLKAFEDVPVAGIFLSQKPADGLESVLEFGKTRRVIVFSPFEGHVERGASGGILISDRILPYVNMESLGNSDIRIKSFFLKIAEVYE